ncbi:MAG: glycine betaine ABC transporter substrate-binding protein [Methanocalculus sp.]|uniref:glycine betaine ABC transporter substrate-binding protein n=1 Tax=Methanocalculus sp. TaxID=2004547 RepID=UPI00271BB988|nr:glycine betaine ABC transporter substrate-binding protein [Methanocalculus sp.]MDO9540122.1 glycine betaine ABC transporter substrate-binding protein [Methanocalculus sp.]
MTSKHMVISIIAGLILISALLVSGCVGEKPAEPAKEISIGYVTWDCAISSTNVLKATLEDAGYMVNLIAVDAGPLYAGLARGDIDVTTTAWLPHTHGAYWEQYGDNLVYVNENIKGSARIGLVVPTYVTINSIEEMNGVADSFDGKIIGIDPGAGIMSATENAIDEYALNYELVASSSGGMAAELRSKINSEEWVVVTGWAPHWKFGRYDLKFLDDPKGVYGDAEDIVTISRVGLKEDKPEAYAILERFQWTADDIAVVMTSIEGGMPEEEAARAWITANPTTVSYWING